MIRRMIDHRSQLGVYLRLNQIEIPGMYSLSADEIKYGPKFLPLCKLSAVVAPARNWTKSSPGRTPTITCQVSTFSGIISIHWQFDRIKYNNLEDIGMNPGSTVVDNGRIGIPTALP